MPTKRTLTRQLADARRHIERLVEQRDEAHGDTTAAIGNQRRLAQQLTEALDEADRLRKELADRPVAGRPGWDRERARLRQELALSERARASLDAQVRQLSDINDRLNRAAYDRTVAAEVTA